MLSQEKINKVLELVHRNPESPQCKMLEYALVSRLVRERNDAIKAIEDADDETERMLSFVPEDQRPKYKSTHADAFKNDEGDSELEAFVRIVEESIKPPRAPRRAAKKDAEGR